MQSTVNGNTLVQIWVTPSGDLISASSRVEMVTSEAGAETGRELGPETLVDPSQIIDLLPNHATLLAQHNSIRAQLIAEREEHAASRARIAELEAAAPTT